MGLFKKNEDYIFLNELKESGLDSYRIKFNDDNVLIKITTAAKEKGMNLKDTLSSALLIYEDIINSGSSKELFLRIIDFLVDNVNNSEIKWNIIYFNLSRAFDKKELIYETLVMIKEKLNLNKGFTFDSDMYSGLFDIICYPLEARKYYLDDRAILSSLSKILDNKDIENHLLWPSDFVSKIVEERLKEDAKQNGIYDIDSGTLSEIQSRLNLIDNKSSELKSVISRAEALIEKIDKESDSFKEKLKIEQKEALEELKNTVEEILNEFNNKYLELIEQEKDSLDIQKNQLIKEMEIDFVEQQARLRKILTEINMRTESNFSKAKKGNGSSTNNEDLNKLLQHASTLKSESQKSEIEVPSIIVKKEEDPIDGTVNFFFDESIPFKKRFDVFLNAKETKIKEGEVFHEKFDDVAKFVILGKTPYLWGPSGCGKTYLIDHQLSKLLNIGVLGNPYVLYEQDVIGYMSANGQYVPGNFYRSYRNGNIIFFDEFDNGVANATIVLNRFLDAKNKEYVFPNGEVTKRHPNFRIITAGNTNCNGRTLAYNTRQKMDEAVIQRFKPIYLNYDNRIEEKILKNHKDWYYFMKNFRRAIESIKTISEDINTSGTFTTRGAADLREYLMNGAFNTDQILEYDFIGTKDMDTLNSIYTFLNDDLKERGYEGEEKKSELILKQFNHIVQSRIGSK